jgi:tRNA(His) guanylyltransferase
MSKSRYEYVRNFEIIDPCLKETYIVVRLDGKGFHEFSQKNNFDKPNDIKALQVIN